MTLIIELKYMNDMLVEISRTTIVDARFTLDMHQYITIKSTEYF